MPPYLTFYGSRIISNIWSLHLPIISLLATNNTIYLTFYLSNFGRKGEGECHKTKKSKIEFLYKKEIARQNLKCKVTLACKVWCRVSCRLGQNPNFLKCVLGLDPLVGIVTVMSICVILLVILLVACRENQWPVRHIFTSIVWPTRRQSHIYTIMFVWKLGLEKWLGKVQNILSWKIVFWTRSQKLKLLFNSWNDMWPNAQPKGSPLCLT